jgi:hypothetical protein
MSNDVWIGALLSVPIGVGTGLAVTPLQQWYRELGKSRAEAERNLMTHQYGQALFYISHPHRFTQYLVVEAVRAIAAIAAMLVGGGISFGTVLVGGLMRAVNAAHPLTKKDIVILWVYMIAGLASSVVGSAYLARVFQRALPLYKRIVNFEAYAATIPADIRNLEIEAMVYTASGGVHLPL